MLLKKPLLKLKTDNSEKAKPITACAMLSLADNATGANLFRYSTRMVFRCAWTKKTCRCNCRKLTNIYRLKLVSHLWPEPKTGPIMDMHSKPLPCQVGQVLRGIF